MANIGINISSAKKTVRNANSYRTKENSNFTKIISKLSKANSYYIGGSTAKLNDIKTVISNRFSIIKTLHSNNVYVINKNISKYEKFVNKSIEKLD